MNSCRSINKKSKIEKAVNKYLMLSVLVQALLCTITAVWGSLWIYLKNKQLGDNAKYFYINLTTCYNNGSSICEEIPIYIEIIFNFARNYLALMNFVAISLLVTIEMVKFG